MLYETFNLTAVTALFW